MLRPFDDYDGFFGQGVLQAERFEVVEIFDAVEIDVVDLEAAVLSLEPARAGLRNSWTRLNVGLVTSSSLAAPRPLMIPLVSVVFPAAQVSFQQHQHRRAEVCRDFAALGDGFFGVSES